MSFISKVEGVVKSIEPIIRLEAIPLDELEGRVLAETIDEGGNFFRKGRVVGTDDIALLRSIALDEAIVYSRPKAVMIRERMTQGRSIDIIVTMCHEMGVVSIQEDCEETYPALRDNVGADLVFMVIYGRIVNAVLEELTRLGGGEPIDIGSAVFVQVGPTPFIVVLDNLEMDELTSTVIKEILGRLSRRSE